MRFCTNCGVRLRDTDRFCTNCGAPVVGAGAGDADTGVDAAGDAGAAGQRDAETPEAGSQAASADVRQGMSSVADAASSMGEAPDATGTQEVYPVDAWEVPAPAPTTEATQVSSTPVPSAEPLRPVYDSSAAAQPSGFASQPSAVGQPASMPWPGAVGGGVRPSAGRLSDRTVAIVAGVVLGLAIVGIFFAVDPLGLREPASPSASAAAGASTGASVTGVMPATSSSSSGSAVGAAATAPTIAATTGSTHVVPSAQTGRDGYVLPDVATRYYTRDELSVLSQDDIRIADNEIFARHGRTFKDASLQSYFEGKSWYRGQYAPDVYDGMPNQLNSYEEANEQLLQSMRSDR